MTPYAAPVDSRFMAAALTAMAGERNATSSKSSDNTMTKMMTAASRRDR